MRSFFYPKLAVSNIKKNGKFYFPYLLTCIGTIALFYILGFITFHPGLESVPGTEIMMFILNLGMIVVGNLCCDFPVLYQQLSNEAAAKGAGTVLYSGHGKEPPEQGDAV